MKTQCVYCEVGTGGVHTSGFNTLNKMFYLAVGSQVIPLYIAGNLNIQLVKHDHV